VNTPVWPVLIVLAGVCPLLVGALVRALQSAKTEATRAALEAVQRSETKGAEAGPTQA
jgi:hypothetical protein